MAEIIFLSHIHEETALAKIIQDAIENEFSGFVDVFVSSDGKTIPSGSNFLKHIEDGLIQCIGAIYLISPHSLKRNWISFELGAVWIRNSMSVMNGGIEIPTIPFCHSGITPSKLPMPLTNLNSILSSSSSDLELAFRSIQIAVGGKGKLKTDFAKLAKNIIDLEKSYTIGDNTVKLFNLLKLNNSGMKKIIAKCKTLPTGFLIKMAFKRINQDSINELNSLQNNELNGYLRIKQLEHYTESMQTGEFKGGDIEIEVSRDLILSFETLLEQKVKNQT